MNDTESWMTFTWFNNFCDPLYFTSLTFRYGLPWWLRVKASTWNAGDQSLIPGLGRSPGEGKWQPTPVLLHGESHGRSLVGSACGRKASCLLSGERLACTQISFENKTAGNQFKLVGV